MKKKFLKLLCCPQCKTSLELHIQEIIIDEIKSGDLKCKVCKNNYKISDYVPIFLKREGFEVEGIKK